MAVGLEVSGLQVSSMGMLISLDFDNHALLPCIEDDAFAAATLIENMTVLQLLSQEVGKATVPPAR